MELNSAVPKRYQDSRWEYMRPVILGRGQLWKKSGYTGSVSCQTSSVSRPFLSTAASLPPCLNQLGSLLNQGRTKRTRSRNKLREWRGRLGRSSLWVAICPGVICGLWAKAWMPNLNCSSYWTDWAKNEGANWADSQAYGGDILLSNSSPAAVARALKAGEINKLPLKRLYSTHTQPHLFCPCYSYI